MPRCKRCFTQLPKEGFCLKCQKEEELKELKNEKELKREKYIKDAKQMNLLCKESTAKHKCKNCKHPIEKNLLGQWLHKHRSKGLPNFCQTYTKATINNEENTVTIEHCDCRNAEQKKEASK